MSTTPASAPPATDTTTDPRGSTAWRAPLTWLAGTVAAADLVFFALIGEVISPLAGGIVLTVIGLVALRRAPRAGIVVLGLTSLIMLGGNLGFAIDHLSHPASAIDFTHAAIGSAGRALALVAAIGAWRGASAPGARRLVVVSIGLAGVTVVTAAVAMITSAGDDLATGDVQVAVADAAFPTSIEAAAGDVLFIDNQDLFRHTFTVTGTGVDVELPASVGVRVPLDLDAGVYEVTCEVPGHDFMTTTLELG